MAVWVVGVSDPDSVKRGKKATRGVSGSVLCSPASQQLLALTSSLQASSAAPYFSPRGQSEWLSGTRSRSTICTSASPLSGTCRTHRNTHAHHIAAPRQNDASRVVMLSCRLQSSPEKGVYCHAKDGSNAARSKMVILCRYIRTNYSDTAERPTG